MGDTWGIAGPTFLTTYAIVALGVLALALVWRARARRGGPAVPARSLSPAEAAFLTGGPGRAALAALGQLRAAGAVAASGGRLVVSGPRPDGLDPFASAMLSAIASGAPQRAGHLWQAVPAATARLESQLARNGLVLGPEDRAQARLGGWVMLAVAGLGLVRLVAGADGGKPIGYLSVMLLAVTAAALVLLLRVPRRTRAGDRVVADLRRQNVHLAPAQSPSWVAYGATGAGLGVALYGAGAFWAADPGFAADARLSRTDGGGAAGGGGDGGGGDGGGGGGGCGGGGCGG